MAGGPHGAEEIGQAGLKTTPPVERIPGLLSYFSVPFLSAIYNDTSQSTCSPVTTSAGIAPAVGEAVVAAKPFPGREFRLCGGAAATPSSPTTSALRHHLSFHLKEGEKGKIQVELWSSS